MTYKILSDKIRDHLGILVCRIWNIESYNDVDRILSIVVNLGLIKCYEIIKKSVKNHMSNTKIMDEIIDTISENGEDVSNPYRFLDNKYINNP